MRHQHTKLVSKSTVINACLLVFNTMCATLENCIYKRIFPHQTKRKIRLTAAAATTMTRWNNNIDLRRQVAQANSTFCTCIYILILVRHNFVITNRFPIIILTIVYLFCLFYFCLNWLKLNLHCDSLFFCCYELIWRLFTNSVAWWIKSEFQFKIQWHMYIVFPYSWFFRNHQFRCRAISTIWLLSRYFFRA